MDVTVEAKYTFGENVAGRVKINATLMSSLRRESLVFYDQTVDLVTYYSIMSQLWHDVVVELKHICTLYMWLVSLMYIRRCRIYVALHI